jgi:hypothetical protein
MKKLAIALLLAGSTGCTFFNSLLFGASDSAGQAVGNEVGTRAANSAMGSTGAGGSMSMATMNPAFLNLYMSVIFTYAFSSGGYEVTPVAYRSGDYTRWTGQGQDGKGVTVERAYLGDDAKGRQWWKVKFTDDKSKTTILEGLLDPAQKRFVRMRAKFPDDAEGKEMPVDESNYYHPAQKLSEDSIEGATKGVEKVTVPAGTFTARHVIFGGIDGTHEWWLDMKIPGGTVRQLVKSAKSDKDKWDMQLAAYGSDAKSELGSK